MLHSRIIIYCHCATGLPIVTVFLKSIAYLDRCLFSANFLLASKIDRINKLD
ncbi:MAG TPA: hypothetical protein V6D28_08560 [Leptolyngbyaceae cyanobacterium]